MSLVRSHQSCPPIITMWLVGIQRDGKSQSTCKLATRFLDFVPAVTPFRLHHAFGSTCARNFVTFLLVGLYGFEAHICLNLPQDQQRALLALWSNFVSVLSSLVGASQGLPQELQPALLALWTTFVLVVHSPIGASQGLPQELQPTLLALWATIVFVLALTLEHPRVCRTNYNLLCWPCGPCTCQGLCCRSKGQWAHGPMNVFVPLLQAYGLVGLLVFVFGAFAVGFDPTITQGFALFF